MIQNAPLVRTMTEADIPAVLEIQAICYTEITPESGDSLHAKLRASRSTCFVAAIDGETVGYIIAVPWLFSSPPMLNAETCQLPAAPDCLYLHDLAVTERARSAGAGRALVDAFLHRLMESKIGRASLVAVQNSEAYWARHGFRAVQLSGQLKAKISSYGADARYMERTATFRIAN